MNERSARRVQLGGTNRNHIRTPEPNAGRKDSVECQPIMKTYSICRRSLGPARRPEREFKTNIYRDFRSQFECK